MLDGKNENPLCVFSIYIKNLHFFMKTLESEDSLQWEKGYRF